MGFALIAVILRRVQQNEINMAVTIVIENKTAAVVDRIRAEGRPQHRNRFDSVSHCIRS